MTSSFGSVVSTIFASWPFVSTGSKSQITPNMHAQKKKVHDQYILPYVSAGSINATQSHNIPKDLEIRSFVFDASWHSERSRSLSPGRDRVFPGVFSQKTRGNDGRPRDILAESSPPKTKWQRMSQVQGSMRERKQVQITVCTQIRIKNLIESAPVSLDQIMDFQVEPHDGHTVDGHICLCFGPATGWSAQKCLLNADPIVLLLFWLSTQTEFLGKSGESVQAPAHACHGDVLVRRRQITLAGQDFVDDVAISQNCQETRTHLEQVDAFYDILDVSHLNPKQQGLLPIRDSEQRRQSYIYIYITYIYMFM